MFEFLQTGKQVDKIDVLISYRIIHLFSEGLYSSPNKAIEELVVNSFDAGATDVHVILPPSFVADDATIVVIDNGTGMDIDGLKKHWIIGVSDKRQTHRAFPKNRKQIGKFGIGKLATYVLAKHLTHISKVGSKYYATSMDYSNVPQIEGEGVFNQKKVSLPLRELTEEEAKKLLSPWLIGTKPGYKEIVLFGKGASKNWTVAIMSGLKEMATEISIGRLRWILSTAMPLRDDFNLYLNGDKVLPSKIGTALEKWSLGKDIKPADLQKPVPPDLEVSEDIREPKNSIHRLGFTHPQLGRITGYVEIFEDLLTAGKSTGLERSHGFFVYVYGRLINIDDEYFGIDSNLLRHGTFSRFRMVVHIDALDKELRSSRETIKQGVLFNYARDLLHAVFNFARNKLEVHDIQKIPGIQVGRRLEASPGSLSKRPILGLIEAALAGKINPRYTLIPKLKDQSEIDRFLEEFRKHIEGPDGLVIQSELSEMTQEQGMAVYDAEKRLLKINTFHPFVAHFLDEYESTKGRLPLELLALSEILLEAQLYETGLKELAVQDALGRRDELLRFLARSAGKRNALMISQDLRDASADKSELENETVASFDSMGFNAIPLGGSGKPDGLAEANLLATESGESQGYKVSLEAKSKEDGKSKVSANTVVVSGIARHRDDFKCDHALVVGPDFPTTKGDDSALVKEITADAKKTGRTITLMRIDDLAKLVRLVPLKRLSLSRIRELFKTCMTPEQSHDWVETIAKEKPKKTPYKNILEAIWDLGKETPSEAIEYSAVQTYLRIKRNITMTKIEIIGECTALSRMAPTLVFARNQSVEIAQRPDKIIAAISATIQQYPEEDKESKNLIHEK